VSAPKRPLPTPFGVVLGKPQGPLPFVPSANPDGTVAWEYVVDPAHYNPYGALHGGVVMALLDSAMGQTVASAVHAQQRFNAAAEMTTHFLAPVMTGRLTAEAHVVKLGKRLAVVEARATAEDGTLVAIATASHALLP